MVKPPHSPTITKALAPPSETGMAVAASPITRLPSTKFGIPAAVTVLRGERRLERMVVPGEYPNPAPQT